MHTKTYTCIYLFFSIIANQFKKKTTLQYLITGMTLKCFIPLPVAIADKSFDTMSKKK